MIENPEPVRPRRKPPINPVDVNLTAMAESLQDEGDLELMAASGCASAARRICDMLAMRAYEEEDEIKAARRAQAMLALGAVRLQSFIARYPKKKEGDSGNPV